MQNILYKTSTGVKPLRVRFDKINGFIKIHDVMRYLVLLDCSCVIKLVIGLNIL